MIHSKPSDYRKDIFKVLNLPSNYFKKYYLNTQKPKLVEDVLSSSYAALYPSLLTPYTTTLSTYSRPLRVLPGDSDLPDLGLPFPLHLPGADITRVLPHTHTHTLSLIDSLPERTNLEFCHSSCCPCT